MIADSMTTYPMPRARQLILGNGGGGSGHAMNAFQKCASNVAITVRSEMIRCRGDTIAPVANGRMCCAMCVEKKSEHIGRRSNRGKSPGRPRSFPAGSSSKTHFSARGCRLSIHIQTYILVVQTRYLRRSRKIYRVPITTNLGTRFCHRRRCNARARHCLDPCSRP